MINAGQKEGQPSEKQKAAEHIISGAEEQMKLALDLMRKMTRQKRGHVREQPRITYQRYS